MACFNIHCRIYGNIKAVQFAINTSSVASLTIVTDSKSSIEAIMKHNNRRLLVVTIRESIATSNGHFTICWVPSHFSIAQKDTAAQESILLPHLFNALTPFLDGNVYVGCLSRQLWFAE